MDPKKMFIDERLSGMCVYCGGKPETREHVPSKVLLDEPYPPQLPIVEACETCNGGFSKDETYVACLIECVVCGSANPNDLNRQKIRKILTENPRLRSQISKSRFEDAEGNIYWNSEVERLKKIIIKLAMGHLAHQISWLRFDEEPCFIECKPLALMTEVELDEFNEDFRSIPAILPEIGSRAFLATFATMEKGLISNWQNWQIVQVGRYRFRIDQNDGDVVRIVLSEYLAFTVAWD
jgi:virulence-associated protein VapD